MLNKWKLVLDASAIQGNKNQLYLIQIYLF